MAALEVIALDTVTPQLRAPGVGDTYTFPRAVAMSVPLPVSSGGTGQSTANAALNALLPSQSGQSGKFLTTDGTDTSWAAAGGGSSTLTIQNKTGAYTVVAGDLGTIINCTSGTFTVSLDPAATLGSGFNCWIWNTGTGAITIDPNGSETIDGVSTLILFQGEGTQIVCDGTNWQTGDKKTMRGYAENLPFSALRPIASGSEAISLGSAYSSGTGSVAIGIATNSSSYGAQGNRAVAIGYFAKSTGASSFAFSNSSSATADNAIAFGTATSASAANSTAIGRNSGATGSQAVTGAGAMALGGSYASGTDSFAAAVANNTSSYGATGANAVAIGSLSKATGADAVSIGDTNTASAQSAVAIGGVSTASQSYAIALGYQANSVIIGKYTYASGQFAALGDAQNGVFVFRRQTADATATVLTTNNSAPGTTNQVILPNNSAYAFTGIVVARQQAADGTASAAWKIEGLIRREANAASTTLVASTVTAIDNTPGWTLALSADTTNGGLKIEATGAAATDIRWVATVQTSEVTYA